jgi:four helix bundle protein
VYRSFEDLEVWKKACDLAVRVYEVLKDCRDYGLKDQMCRAAVSIPSNVAEGVERDSAKETTHFLHIAKGSCAELRTQIIIGGRISVLDGRVSEQLVEETKVISRMLHGLITSLPDA